MLPDNFMNKVVIMKAILTVSCNFTLRYVNESMASVLCPLAAKQAYPVISIFTSKMHFISWFPRSSSTLIAQTCPGVHQLIRVYATFTLLFSFFTILGMG